MTPITTIRKGAKVRLQNGFNAIVLDNLVRAHTRLCEVAGPFPELGSVYTTDIVQVWDEALNRWDNVGHAPAQLAAAQKRQMMGF